MRFKSFEPLELDLSAEAALKAQQGDALSSKYLQLHALDFTKHPSKYSSPSSLIDEVDLKQTKFCGASE